MVIWSININIRRFWFIKMKETKIAKENVRKMKITEERIYLLMIFLGVLLILYEVFII